MKANFGMIVVDGRGKIGDEVASRNRFGAYFRELVTPLNPDTAFQQDARQNLRDVNDHWIALTESQRLAWSVMAPNYKKKNVFGKVYVPSGYQLHQSVNMNRLILGELMLETPEMPIKVFSKPITGIAIVGNPGVLSITFSSFGGFPARVALYATPGLSVGKNFVKSEFRMLFTTSGVNGNVINFGDQWEARFGPFIPGTKIFVKLRWIMPSTGQSVEGNKFSYIIP